MFKGKRFLPRKPSKDPSEQETLNSTENKGEIENKGGEIKREISTISPNFMSETREWSECWNC